MMHTKIQKFSYIGSYMIMEYKFFMDFLLTEFVNLNTRK